MNRENRFVFLLSVALCIGMYVAAHFGVTQDEVRLVAAGLLLLLLAIAVLMRNKKSQEQREMWKLEDERYRLQIQHFEETSRMQEEAAKMQRKYYEDRKGNTRSG